MSTANLYNDELSTYRLRDLKNGFYQLHSSSGQAYEGTWLAILVAADEQFGIDLEDMELAKNELEKLGHDYAEFGMLGRLLYTCKNEIKAA